MQLIGENPRWAYVLPSKFATRWPDDVILVDFQSPELSSHLHKRAIVVAEKLPPIEVVRLIYEGSVRHVLHTSTFKLKHEVEIAAEMINNPAAFFDNPIQFLFQPIARETPTPVTVWSHKFWSSKDKPSVMSELKKFAKDRGLTTIQSDTLTLVGDELFTNAMFSAPRDEVGKKIYAKLNRRAVVEYGEGLQANLFVAFDETKMIIGCEDPYGSLKPVEEMILRLGKCIKEGPASTLNFEDGGAGLGAYLMFEGANAMYVGVQRAQKTVVAFGLPTTRGKPEDNELKNVHIIYDQD